MEPTVSTEPPLAADHDVTVRDAMKMAIAFQQRGQLEDAEKVYNRIFEVAPDHPDVVHFYGVLQHQLGRSEEAIETIKRSLALEPDRPECYNNLGIILRQVDRDEEALAAYTAAVELDPTNAEAHNNLGVLHRFMGNRVEAEAAYRKAIELKPTYAEAYHNLGVLMTGQKRHREAILCYFKVLSLEPSRTEDRRMLVIAYCEIGERELAIELVEKWIKDEPDSPIARHTFAAVSGRNVPARAEDAYVEVVFDGFAESFDRKLEQLSYRAPALVADTIKNSGLEPTAALDVLDAGCGTGLCGALIKPYARQLVGVDLSTGMMSKAQQKLVYDQLVKDELTHYLQVRHEVFDLIVSADTLCYFGSLEEVAAAAHGALRPGGQFIFTLEELVAPAEGVEYRIEAHGRYNHARRYVERILQGAGFTPSIAHADLRTESALPVSGLVVRATKVTADLQVRPEVNGQDDANRV
jgi:predicted TPR repeat methyltransferase